MAKKHERLIWSRRCQWSAIIVTVVALVVYNAVANLWLLRPASCPIFSTPPQPEPAYCEPCTDTATNTIDDDPLSHLDLRLGRWNPSRTLRMFDYAAVGDLYPELSTSNQVCLATQTSIDRLHELLRIAAHWTGPISVAVFVAGDELRILRAFATWLLKCKPEMYARIALHVAIPADRPAIFGSMPNWARNCKAKPLFPKDQLPDDTSWRIRNPYPQNHLRNLARKNSQTPYVFLVDIDIVPSIGMTESLNKFLSSTPKGELSAYVIPTYELDLRVRKFPQNKSELVRLSRKALAVPFHRKVFIYNQFASNFTKWEENIDNTSTDVKINHNVTNFELFYEPFYIAPDTVPPHDERFLGYGFTRNTQPDS